jgi:hypothetical protein
MEATRVQERRKLTRTRVLAAARIILDDSSMVSCTVRDLTTLGAGIETAQTFCIVDFPHNFDLRFDGAQSLRSCQLMWRAFNRMGVKFVEAE